MLSVRSMKVCSDLLLWNVQLGELFVNYIKKKLFYLFVFAGYGMAAAIAASVLVSVGVKDAGDGDSHCHDIQQILFVVGQKGFSGVRKNQYKSVWKI